MNSSDMLAAIAIPSVLLFVGWILYLFFRRYQVSAQIRMQRIESFNKMIEKFGSAKEFTEFAQSEQGKKLLVEPVMPHPNPLSKVLRFLQAGIIFIMVGLAAWINGSRLESRTEPQYVSQMVDSFHWGTFATFIGAGLVLAAVISYIFVRYWHLANGNAGK